MERHISSFALLGSRRYVHSTSIWHYLVSLFENKEISSCKLMFRKKLYSEAELFIEEGAIGSIENANAELYLVVEGKEYVTSVKAIDKEISRTVLYDEDSLVGNARIDDEKREILIDEVNKDRLINIIVAANKKLLLTLLDNEGWSGWSVGKWDLKWSALLQNIDGAVLKVRLKHVLKEQYARSYILIGENKLGTIEYARERKDV